MVVGYFGSAPIPLIPPVLFAYFHLCLPLLAITLCPLAVAITLGLALIFVSWCFSYRIFALCSFGSSTIILQYFLSRLD